ncbi:MAG: LuxR C-terminal-related transcriptional regulator, partial [Planctomycetota bacterium]
RADQHRRVRFNPQHYVEAAVARVEAERAAQDQQPVKRIVQADHAIADYFKRVGELFEQFEGVSRDVSAEEKSAETPPAAPATPPEVATLTPRQNDVLQGLLAGDGHKQIAANLGISKYTVADHVKDLHRIFDVSSRGELLAKFIRR